MHDLGEGEAGHVHHHHQAGDLRLWLPGHSLEAEVVGGEYVGRGDGVGVPDASPVLYEEGKLFVSRCQGGDAFISTTCIDSSYEVGNRSYQQAINIFF